MVYSKLRACAIATSILLIVPSVTLIPPTAIAQSDIRTQRVQFKPGSTSATVQGSIKGYQIVDYILNVKQGQTMNVSMATDNGANYFNIMEPGQTQVAIFNGSTNGNQFEGALKKSGDYRIRVYMMRSAARRNEVANYRLEMIVSGGPSSSGGNAPIAGQTRKDAFDTVCGVIVNGTNYRYRCKAEDFYSGGRKTQTILYYPDQTIRLVWKSGNQVELNFEGMVPQNARYSTSEGETDFFFEDKTYFYISDKGAARWEVQNFQN